MFYKFPQVWLCRYLYPLYRYLFSSLHHYSSEYQNAGNCCFCKKRKKFKHAEKKYTYMQLEKQISKTDDQKEQNITE